MSRHRLETVRPRYGRMVAAAASLAVTVAAVGGALGVLPSDEAPPRQQQVSGDAVADVADVLPRPAAPLDAPATEPDRPERSGRAVAERVVVSQAQKTGRVSRSRTATAPLPPASGRGRRVVFSESAQRVWLVGGHGHVRRTYLVSGSLYDNLEPGTYEVFSRSEQAWGIDDSGTMRWFVRFAEGPNAAIGFHSIPVLDGTPLQTLAQLGTPQSHGCIRQRDADARALWAFAPVGTTVVVTA